MPLFTTLMVLVLTASTTLTIFTISRLFAYNRKYHLPESQYTKLFHFITKEHVAIVYVLFVLTHVTLTIWFLITL